jgi:hypothetical protein
MSPFPMVKGDDFTGLTPPGIIRWLQVHDLTYYVLFFIHLGSRRVQVAGVTPHPNEA